MALEPDEVAAFRPAAAPPPRAAQQPPPAASTGTAASTGRSEDQGRSESPGRSQDPEATQASEPVFDDVPRRSAPPPPPPLPDPEPKPLFAPGPPRAPGPDHDHRADTFGSAHGIHSTHGSGSLPPVWGPDQMPDDDWGTRDNSRDWLKLAAALGVVLLLVVAIVFAFNLGRGSGGDPGEGAVRQGATPGAQASQPLRIAGVSDLDPPPDGNGEENPDLAGRAVDGDPSTAWQTVEYYRNPQFGNLKEGVGLVVDLGRPQQVASVQVTLIGNPTSLEILAAPEGGADPSGVASLTRVAAADGVGGRNDLDARRAGDHPLPRGLADLPPAGRRRFPRPGRGDRGAGLTGVPGADGRDDRALLAAHLAGDHDAFGVLFARHRDRLWAVALRTTGDREEAADALQDALVSAFRRADSFRGDSAVTTWLHRIVVNACLDRLRRRKSRTADPLPDDLGERVAAGSHVTGTHDDPADLVLDEERRTAVLRALDSLPPDQRAALVLVDMQGYPVEEAAAVLGCPPGTVKSRCSRGRARLAPLLSDVGPAGEPGQTAVRPSTGASRGGERT